MGKECCQRSSEDQTIHKSSMQCYFNFIMGVYPSNGPRLVSWLSDHCGRS